jgi:hypothetical protein
MIIQIENGQRQPIDGVATEASVTARGDTATVAVATTNLIALPRPGKIIEMMSGKWEVVKTTSRTRELVTFTCRRSADVG